MQLGEGFIGQGDGEVQEKDRETDEQFAWKGKGVVGAQQGAVG